MPSVTLHPKVPISETADPISHSPLPSILQTPSGLALLEIQGTFHITPTPGASTSTTESVATSSSSATSTHPSNPQETQSNALGRLVFPDSTAETPVQEQKVHLYVGKYQRLTGQMKKLDKPVAVIRKKEASSNESDDMVLEGEEELEIVEVVRYKILFSSRPEPVGD